MKMKTRREVIREVGSSYRQATKRRKSDMLDELVLVLDCTRAFLARALHQRELWQLTVIKEEQRKHEGFESP